MEPKSIYLTIFISLLTISSARGNYGYGQQYGQQFCDKNVYNRAKEMIRLQIQQQSTNSNNNNNNLNGRLSSGSSFGGSSSSGSYDSRYPALTNSYQSNNNNNNSYRNGNFMSDQINDHQCKLMRQSFDDILINTPLCDPIGSYQFQVSTELIQQARNFLSQFCERNQGWRYAQCFKRREILDCENQFIYLKQNPRIEAGRSFQNPLNNNQFNGVSYELCQAFETFRNCVISHSRTQCYTTDLDLLGTYLVDKAQQSAWSCLPPGINPATTVNSGDIYSRRTDINYPSQPGSGYYPPPPYAQFQNIPQSNPITISPFTSQQQPGLQNQPYSIDNIDRAGGALSGLHAGTVSVCIERVRPFETQCLDHLIQKQKEARYGRSSTDVQRRICCALFRYRDCLSRVVLERCFDNSRVTVDILMGDRNREISQTCRDITRDQCNGAGLFKSSIPMIAFSIFITYLATLTSFN